MSEVRYHVRGGNRLRGTAVVQGAKNAALPMIGAALLATSGRTVLRNVPAIADVRRAVELARLVGAEVEYHPADRLLVIDAAGVANPLLPAELTRRFRGSVLFLSSVLHRCGQVIYEGAGGCNIGTRGLDFHYRGLARLGAHIEEHDGTIHVKAGELRGADLYLDTPSHTGTENLIIAAALTPGRTVIENAALEPEVLDVIAFLDAMGARISGGGTGRIVIDGVEELRAVEHTIMPDRIDAGVLCIATALTGGEVTLVGGSVLDHFGVFRHKLEQMGVVLTAAGAVTTVTRPGPLHPINVITDTHPGFATDLQPPLLALATQAPGVSYFRERIHDARYALVPEINQLGARIAVDGEKAVVHGPTPLRGAEVVARDLRTGIALVLAGLVAEGETVVGNGAMIERGHADLVTRFAALGADVRREVVD
ncbi:UDP-N-acetylglucosamine 1-carboxyvinyltransferase [Micromonospora sp. NPDC049559]|uniref:UDP-N-acetylglucosamine 1-carboxyvinyltransferase n=1 Tax=Micromonospora sp. NPDC049559 TaxID=3155923 RepID=UPI003444A3E4